MRSDQEKVPLGTIAREWGRLGIVGVGGPPTHIRLLRELCVEERGWLEESEFHDAIASVNLLPGPASTQLAIYCAWRLRGRLGGLLGGLCFICPGLAIILALSVLFLMSHPPRWVDAVALGASAAVPPVALHAAKTLLAPSWQRVSNDRARRIRWLIYVAAGGGASVAIGPLLVVVIISCGLLEFIWVRRPTWTGGSLPMFAPLLGVAPMGGLGALAWVAFSVGALSYGGGFVIIPLMQKSAVLTYHWMSAAQFLNAVALGQVTPGPVVQTIAVVGYAAGGVGGGLLAALVAFAPSFMFVFSGGPHFDRLRRNDGVHAFLVGAGACAIGAIGGSSIALGLDLAHLWQLGVMAVAALWLVVLGRSVVVGILGAGALGVIAIAAGAPLGH